MKVLDAWAIMAWLKDLQPAASHVRVLLDHGQEQLLMSIVNLGEVLCLSVRAKDIAYGERVLSALRRRLTVVAATDGIVLAAAILKSRNAVSYANAFAAATALSREAPLVTGDPEFQVMAAKERSLKLEWIATSK